jgi:replication factor A1
MSPLDDVLSKLSASSKLSQQELETRVRRKQDELHGLVSAEGAAHLVAKELGVNLLGNGRRKLDIKNIIAGMRNVSVAGRVFRVSTIRDFKKANGADGRVTNLHVGDRTGFIVLPLWNDQVKLVEEESVKLGDVVQITGAMANENRWGDIELSLGKFGQTFAITDEVESSGMSAEFPDAAELEKNFLGARTERVPIRSISPGVFEIKATVIDVVRGNFFFNVCPKCGRKAFAGATGRFECAEHGQVDAEPAMVVSMLADDGTGVLRIAAFRNVAEQLTTTTAGELSRLGPDERYNIVSGSVVGKEYIIHGRVKKSNRSDELEMVADSAKSVNASEESERLASLLKMKLG